MFLLLRKGQFGEKLENARLAAGGNGHTGVRGFIVGKGWEMSWAASVAFYRVNHILDTLFYSLGGV